MFSPRRAGPPSVYCKPCAAQYARERATPESRARAAERQRVRRQDPVKAAADRETSLAWKKRNPQRTAVHDKSPEKVAYNKRWRAANRDRDVAAARRYQAKNPEIGKVSQQRRRARLLNVDAPLTQAQWVEIIADFNGACAYCLRTDLPLQQEHMTPLSRGGKHDKANVIPSCGPCNYRKHTRTLLEYLMIGAAA